VVAPPATPSSVRPAAATASLEARPAQAYPLTPDAEFRAAPPEPAPPAPYKVPSFERFRLKNGLEVVLAEAHDLPLVDLSLVVKTGGGANPPGLAGLADLTANMLDEGTKTRSALQIADELATLGAALMTGASWDASTATVSTLSRNLDQALAVYADVLTHPAFDDKEFNRVRDNLVSAISRRKDSPPAIASLTLARAIFGDSHPYAWPQAGVAESLHKITLADLKRFYATYYKPGNAVLIAVGDTTQKELRAKLGPLLEGWKGGAVPARKLPTVTPPPKRTILLVDKPEAPQSSIRVGIVGLERKTPDYFPAIAMNTVLGGSFYRLDTNLREAKGWTYGARSAFDMRKTPGLFAASGEFVANHTADAVNEILAEMKRMVDADVTDQELDRVKDQLSKSFPARFATRASTAGQLAELAIYGLPESYLTDYVTRLHAVTKADVRKLAGKVLKLDKMTVVVVGDRKANEAALAGIAPVELRDLEGAPLGAPSKGDGAPPGGDKDKDGEPKVAPPNDGNPPR
jgi:predicted Zn-dependent peptidase